VIDTSEDLAILNTFFDALDAGKACEHLEAEEIEFLLEDLSVRQQGVSRFQEGSPVRLDVFVHEEDLERARKCLRRTMSLFPEREVGVVEHGGAGDEVLAQAAACEELKDAEAVRIALTNAGIWSIVQKIVDDEDASFVTYSVEVNGKDVETALRVVERWGETL
jgi:Putative prokaryotic signal transducing protein